MASAVGIAVLDTIEEDKCQENSKIIGTYVPTPSIMTFSITTPKKSDPKRNSKIVLSVVYAKWCIFWSITQLVIMQNVVMLGNKICDQQHYTFGQGTLSIGPSPA
jgi:hypothetical protein